MYVTIFLIIRLMGKREIGKQSVFDLVIFVMMAEMAAIVIEDTKRPFMHGLLPILVLLIVQVCLALISLKSRRLRLLFDGKPTILVDRGQLNRKAMRKQRYSLDDLMQQMRENQIATMKDVDFAVLEPSGKLSIIKKESANNTAGNTAANNQKQGKELPKPFPKHYRFESLPVPLVMDGKLIAENLKSLDKDRFWLNSQLKAKGVNELKNVFLCTIDHRGELYINVEHQLR
ncbi:DUF421 domain-containing protein [Paenibacillus sp. GCM10027626]|uniref:DUF421 domain-containing protein n=1 Tax=Paenibacillus sp. GCM10027626 TaxID=3273411 RepID=UPI003627494D